MADDPHPAEKVHGIPLPYAFTVHDVTGARIAAGHCPACLAGVLAREAAGAAKFGGLPLGTALQMITAYVTEVYGVPQVGAAVIDLEKPN